MATLPKAIVLLLCLAAIDAFAPVRKCASVVAGTSQHYFTRSQKKFGGLQKTPSSGTTNNPDSSINPRMFMTSAPNSSASDASIPYQLVALVGKTASSFVSVSFFLLLATRRDALVLTLFIGSIFNAVSSKVLKKLLNHERPANLQSNENVKLKPSDGGMPSSHAMSLGFIGTVITCAIIPVEQQIIAGSAMAVYSMLALRYRIRDHLHTLEQVAVGLTLGVVNALAWLYYAVGLYGGNTGVILWVKQNCVSSETGVFPYAALSIPIVVGVLVVGSFERRIALWLKEKKSKSQ